MCRRWSTNWRDATRWGQGRRVPSLEQARLASARLDRPAAVSRCRSCCAPGVLALGGLLAPLALAPAGAAMIHPSARGDEALPDPLARTAAASAAAGHRAGAAAQPTGAGLAAVAAPCPRQPATLPRGGAHPAPGQARARRLSVPLPPNPPENPDANSALLLAAGALLALPAAAHITLDPTAAAAGSYVRAALRVPHGCAGAATTRVTLDLPEGIYSAKPMPKPGWRLTIERRRLPRRSQPAWREIEEEVGRITWEAAPAGRAVRGIRRHAAGAGRAGRHGGCAACGRRTPRRAQSDNSAEQVPAPGQAAARARPDPPGRRRRR